jgi:hypothetical protein
MQRGQKMAAAFWEWRSILQPIFVTFAQHLLNSRLPGCGEARKLHKLNELATECQGLKTDVACPHP